MTSFELFYLGLVLGFGIPAITYWGFLFIKSYRKFKTKPPVDQPHNRADGIDWDSITSVTNDNDQDIYHVSLGQRQPYDTIHRHGHVHVLETDKCLKNRYGPRCL